MLNTTLERACEHYIRAVCPARKLSVDAAWKQLATQSERQLGAFIFLFLLFEGTSPTPANDLAEIRNRVVHRGAIAANLTAATFGAKVFARIHQIEMAP